MKLDPSTAGIVRRLTDRQHKNIPGHGFAKARTPVVAHDNVQSVGTDSGAKPHAHDCSGDCNVAGNAATNEAMRSTGSPRLTNKPGQIVASTKTN
jgi:hypothetical protein